MEPKPGIAAVRKLADLGYRFNVQGGTIKGRYEGPGEPDPAQVRLLLAQVGANKAEVLAYLQSLEDCQAPRGPLLQPSEKELPHEETCPCGSPAWGVGEDGPRPGAARQNFGLWSSSGEPGEKPRPSSPEPKPPDIA